MMYGNCCFQGRAWAFDSWQWHICMGRFFFLIPFLPSIDDWLKGLLPLSRELASHHMHVTPLISEFLKPSFTHLLRPIIYWEKKLRPIIYNFLFLVHKPIKEFPFYLFNSINSNIIYLYYIYIYIWYDDEQTIQISKLRASEKYAPSNGQTHNSSSITIHDRIIYN